MHVTWVTEVHAAVAHELVPTLTTGDRSTEAKFVPDSVMLVPAEVGPL